MALLRIFRRAEASTPVALDLQVAAGPASGALAGGAAAARGARATARGEHGHRRLPPALAAYRPVRAEQLDAPGRHALAKLFQNLPLPAPALAALLAPQHDGEGAAELAVRLAAEPGLAARLVEASGAPHVERAIEHLGVADARGLAIRWLLHSAFATGCPRRRALLDDAWQASAAACAIASHLARSLRLADTPALVGRTAMTFVGRLATVATMPQGLLDRVPARGWLERCSAEQALLGLSSAEIGRLLMHAWGMPAAAVDEAAEVDAVLFAPHAAWEPQRARRLALCYLSARAGERLAADPALEPAGIDPAGDPDPELHQLRGYLDDPALRGALADLRDTALRDAVRRWRAVRPPGS